MIELTGSVLAAWSADERMAIAAELRSMGGKVTRMDIAVDFHRMGLNLFKNALECAPERQGGERVRPWKVCGCKTSEVYVENGQYGLKGRTLYLGRRGKDGSGRLVRCYDKGLEQRATTVPGEWERWELELRHECACIALDLMMNAGERWIEVATGVALGAVDFREVTGSRSLARRPRCEWWQSVIDTVETIRVRATPKLPTLAGLATWAQKGIAPLFYAVKRRTGLTFDQIFEKLGCHDEGKEPSRRSAVWQFLDWYSGDYEDADDAPLDRLISDIAAGRVLGVGDALPA